MPRVALFAIAICLAALVQISTSQPVAEEVQYAEPLYVVADEAALIPEESVAPGAERPKRQFLAGLVTGALLAGGGRPYYGYGYGVPYGHHHHHHRPHYPYGGYGGGYYGGGYYGYGK